MNIYRVIFAKNEILSIREVSDNSVLNGIYQYEHKNGKLLYAVINSENEENALTIASIIVKEASEKVFGSDYLN